MHQEANSTLQPTPKLAGVHPPTCEEARPGVFLVSSGLAQLVQPPRINSQVLAMLAVHRLHLTLHAITADQRGDEELRKPAAMRMCTGRRGKHALRVRAMPVREEDSTPTTSACGRRPCSLFSFGH